MSALHGRPLATVSYLTFRARPSLGDLFFLFNSTLMTLHYTKVTYKRLLTKGYLQKVSYKKLLTEGYLQKVTYRKLLTEGYLQEVTYMSILKSVT